MKNDKEVTIYDIASTLGISPSTVSRALNNHLHISSHTRDRICKVAEELGYQPNKFASNLRRNKTNTIGVIVPNIKSYFMATALAGIEEITSRSGYGLIIAQSGESGIKEASGIKTLFNSRVDGILVSLASDTETLEHFDILYNKSIPVVFFDRVKENSGSTCVIIDNYKASYEITTHLIRLGCRRIFHITGNLSSNVYLERFKGYRQALADKKVSYNRKWLFSTDLTENAGSAAVKRFLLFKDKPDAVFAANDNTAVTVIMELKKNGIRIPEEIAVAGFNNDPVSLIIQPDLTTIDYPARELGMTAANELVKRLNKADRYKVKRIILNHKLIIRSSSQLGKLKS